MRSESRIDAETRRQRELYAELTRPRKRCWPVRALAWIVRALTDGFAAT